MALRWRNRVYHPSESSAGSTSWLATKQVPEQPQRVADQTVDQLGAELFVVPGDAGFARGG
jgi:hypothetical protein